MDTTASGKHTPAPWHQAGGKGKKGQRYIWSDRDEKGKGYIGTHEICVAEIHANARLEGDAAYAEEEIEANARRVIALVNACEGIPTEDLERVAARFPTDRAATLRYLADVANRAALEGSPCA